MFIIRRIPFFRQRQPVVLVTPIWFSHLLRLVRFRIDTVFSILVVVAGQFLALTSFGFCANYLTQFGFTNATSKPYKPALIFPLCGRG
jgi:hypothetical protein